MRYNVISRRPVTRRGCDDEGESVEVIEATRTDRKTAYEDVQLIRDIFRRAAWVEETDA